MSTVGKRAIFIHAGQDIESPVRFSINSEYKGISTVKGYKNTKTMLRALLNTKINLLILDTVIVEDPIAFLEELKENKVTFKMLLIVSAGPLKEAEMEYYLKSKDLVLDIIRRPFTIDRLHSYLKKKFGFKKSEIQSVSTITTDSLKQGMVLADDIYVPGTTDLLIECGTVLDDENLKELIKNKIKNIKVHSNAGEFLNCWEFMKCNSEEGCPASFLLQADGFNSGVNGGRACLFVRNTVGPCSGSFSNFTEKFQHLCSACDFYKLLYKNSDHKISDLVDYIKSKKDKAATHDKEAGS